MTDAGVAVAGFEATSGLHGKTATDIEVPAAALEALVRGRRPAVTATLNGYAYRTSVGSMGGRSLLPVSAEHRQRAGSSAGDVVQVELTPDDAPRTVQVPEDLAAALAAEPAAAAAFARLSASAQQRHTLAVGGAKQPETRANRVAAIIASLRGDGA